MDPRIIEFLRLLGVEQPEKVMEAEVNWEYGHAIEVRVKYEPNAELVNITVRRTV